MSGPTSTFTAWPMGFSGDNQAGCAGDMAMDMDVLLRGLSTLLENGVDGPYTCRLTGNQLRQLRHDAKNFDDTALAAFDCRIVVSRDLPQTPNAQGVVVYVGELTGNADNVRVELHTS